MTIFGFNTDIRHGNTVFHVQTEARANEFVMQSAIFVRGRCIGKHTVSYAEQAHSSEFGEDYIHQLVTQQHRRVVNSIREGRLETLLNDEGAAAAAPAAGPANVERAATTEAAAAALAQPEKLTLEWLPDGLVWEQSGARMRFLVRRGVDSLTGARLIARLDGAGAGPVYAECTSDSQGEAELVYHLDGALSSGSCCTVLLRVIAGEGSLTRKFRLQRG